MTIKRLLPFIALLLLASPAGASIALFVDGRAMKISSYKVVGDSEVQLSLTSGGAITVPLSRVDRILDDEIIPAAIVEEVKKAVEKDGGIFPTRSWRYDEARQPLFKSKFDAIIVEAAKKFDVDASLVSAVIKAESDFNSREVSDKGARGLMQLMPSTAERFGVTDSYDPVANIYGGVRYLRWLLKTFNGNADLAVAAYNAGEGNVWKYNGVPPFRETINYINRIAKHIRNAMPATPAASKVADSRAR
ncbi:MAG TPA: lytic transglycosylase domain-containing protein [Thermoanaerobaculia bacterium]|jgi:soluble lytic murein transglycosylase-like protein|nr:lytic transglycosylase domain-containing protein [Thermoanaerobaculia bacterium]